MTQEDKKLLLKDISARLPYGIICDCLHSISCKATIIDADDMTVYYTDCDEWESIEHCKPYLRPMSSMNDEERTEYELLANHCIVTVIGFIHLEAAPLIDWLNAHHFDYRCLIDKGLALVAPSGMYQ